MSKLIKTLVINLLITLMVYSASPNMDKVIQMQDKNDPAIIFKIWFNAGSQFDPKGKEGLAYFTARMLSESSTKNMTYDQILEKLFPMASSYYCTCSTEMVVFSGKVHKDNVYQYYNLFTNAIVNPVFSEKDFSRIKDEILNYLENNLRYTSDEELGKAVLYNRIYANTAYGHIEQGTITGINNITINDVKNFYNKYYNRNNFTIGIAGSFDDNIVKKLRSDLKKLPAGQQPKLPDIRPEKISGKNILFIEKQANATAISMGFPIDVLRGKKEWYALAIMNSWFGEHRNSSSHLYQIIREARGLNYGDYSYIEKFPNAGSLEMPSANVSRRNQIFEIWIRPVPNETRHFVLRAALYELQKLYENGLSKEQFDATRKFLKNYVLHYASTLEERLEYALDDKFYGIDGSHLENFRKMMDEITYEDVQQAIKKYINPDNMIISIITKDAENFKSEITANAESIIKYSTPKPHAVLEEDKLINNFKIKVANTNILKVEDLFK